MVIERRPQEPALHGPLEVGELEGVGRGERGTAHGQVGQRDQTTRDPAALVCHRVPLCQVQFSPEVSEASINVYSVKVRLLKDDLIAQNCKLIASFHIYGLSYPWIKAEVRVFKK